MGKLHVVDHPLIQHKLTIMRMTETGGKDFRQLLNEITELMGYELTRDLPLDDIRINTPVAPMTGKAIMGKKLAIVPILRAGLGMVDGLLNLIPVAKVGHIGLYRDPETHEPVEYLLQAPADIDGRLVIVVDPMLATGGQRCRCHYAYQEARRDQHSSAQPCCCSRGRCKSTERASRC